MIQSRELPRQYVDPSELVSPIAANRSARIFVVTDPADHRVPLEWQMMFVRKLRQAGGAVDQFFVEAPDEQRHNVANHSLLAVAGCVRAAPTLEISGSLDAYTVCRRHRFRESACVRPAA
jgi:hypothetical protein